MGHKKLIISQNCPANMLDGWRAIDRPENYRLKYPILPEEYIKNAQEVAKKTSESQCASCIGREACNFWDPDRQGDPIMTSRIDALRKDELPEHLKKLEEAARENDSVLLFHPVNEDVLSEEERGVSREVLGHIGYPVDYEEAS